MHLGCVATDYKHPLKCQAKCIAVLKGTIFYHKMGVFPIFLDLEN